MNRVAPSIVRCGLVFTAVLTLSSCGEDSPTTSENPNPSTDQATVTLSRLDFGPVCVGQSKTLSFEIQAPDSNVNAVSGNVSLCEQSGFSLTTGGGPFVLGPGEARLVEVLFTPETVDFTSSSCIDIGIGDTSVQCVGYGSEYPWIRFDPTALVDADITSNNLLPLARSVLVGGGVSYSKPGWHSCPTATWIFDGNPVTESVVAFEFEVPAGTSTVLIAIGLDASSTCAQLLMEIDGNENTRTNFSTPCTTRLYRFNIAPGVRTIRIGTDQQGVTCFSDISIQHVTFTFEGHCLFAYEWWG